MSTATRPILASIPQTIFDEISSFLTDSERESSLNTIIYDIFARTVLINTENARILFLDIDGVLLDNFDFFTYKQIITSTKRSQLLGMTEPEWAYSFGLPLDTPPIKMLSTLFTIKDIAIVLCSARRNKVSVPRLRELAEHTFGSYVIGKTPDHEDFDYLSYRKEHLAGWTLKGPEIEYWLQTHNWKNNKFAILDDVPDGIKEKYEDHYVHVDPEKALTKSNVEKVRHLLE